MVLDEQPMRLSDVIALKPGSQFILRQGREAPVQLRCGQVILFEGRIGRRKNRVAVRIEQVVGRLPGGPDSAGPRRGS